MKKEVVSVPQFEYQPVQKGTKEIEMWVTSHGRKFDNEKDAEQHEFLWRVSWKNRSPNLHYEVEAFEFQTLEEAVRYEKMYEYRFRNKDYNLESFQYPCKVVMYDEYIGCINDNQCKDDGEDCMCSHEDTNVKKMVYLEDYKKMIIDHLDSL